MGERKVVASPGEEGRRKEEKEGGRINWDDKNSREEEEEEEEIGRIHAQARKEEKERRGGALHGTVASWVKRRSVWPALRGNHR